MAAAALLDELRERLGRAYGERLSTIVLFGSEARGEAGPESDIDLLVVLERLVGDYGEELERGLTAVYPVSLRLGRRISVGKRCQSPKLGIPACGGGHVPSGSCR
jgi:predicted nucleotidyltransferase